MLVDSHCHLNFPDLAERIPQVIQSMKEAQVGLALCISTRLEDFPKVRALAERHPELYASVGVHPDEKEGAEPSLEELVRLADHPRVVGIGETGLDYYWNKGDNEWQRERFRVHVRAAKQAGKPLIVHTREAAEDTLRILEQEGADEAGGVMHCFTETLPVAQRAMEMGFHISFSGIVTFKNAAALKEVAKAVPLERMLVETDSPYLAPVPHRGKTNEPAYVRFVAEEIARLKDVPFEAVAEATTANFHKLFRISTS